jgi:hypothetical protein
MPKEQAAGYKISGGHADGFFDYLDEVSQSLNDKQ